MTDKEVKRCLELLDETFDFDYIYDDDMTTKYDCHEAIAIAKESIRPEGEWIFHKSQEGLMYECSICKRVVRVISEKSLQVIPYCHCGAKMKYKETPLKEKARVTTKESCFLEQGITQGIV